MWIGKDDGYVRRVQATAGGKKGNGHGTVTFSDFGKSVTVSVPPASDTADATARPVVKLKDDPLDSSDHSLERMVSAMITHLSVLLLGFALSYFFFPKIVMMAVPIDPQTGVPLGPLIEIPADKVREFMKHAVEADQPPKSPQPSTAPSADPGKGADVQH